MGVWKKRPTLSDEANILPLRDGRDKLDIMILQITLRKLAFSLTIQSTAGDHHTLDSRHRVEEMLIRFPEHTIHEPAILSL